ncbi:MAG: hypothetical protein ACPG45_02885 [Flavobacteriaceae bacterium]
MSTKKHSIIFILIIFCSCNSYKTETTEELRNIFTNREIKDINRLVDFFETRMNSNKHNLNDKYKHWIISNSNIEDDTWEKFNLKDLLQVYKKIDSTTFNEIWQFNEMRYLETKDTLSYLNLAYEKKYHQYLVELGKKSKKMEWYANKAYQSGDLPQLMDLHNLFITVDTINESPKIQPNYDFNERVLITISSIKHYDNYHRKEKFRK